MTYDVDKIRSEFPILTRTVYGKPLIYLDNAATSQTPRAVVDRVEEMYYAHKANVHRGVHCLSQEATDAMEPRGRPQVYQRPVDRPGHIHTWYHRGSQSGGRQLRPAARTG